MKNFTDYLTATTFKQLTAILATHGLQRSAQDKKTDVIAQLQMLLTNPATLTSIVAQLDAVGKDALRHLLAANGSIPVHTFEKRYGSIRPYKPWRKDEQAGTPQPWLAPISTTETLWYLGLIYRDPPKPKPGIVQHYVLPAELLPLIAGAVNSPTAPPSHCPTVPPAHRPTVVSHPGRNGPLDHHLAIWLATVHAGLAGQGVKPVHKRWLPPSLVALLCARLGLDQEADFSPIRSERHHPYLAFLHYLALAADLVTVTTAFQLTPAGWAWLNADGPTRQQQLNTAWHQAPADLAGRFTLRWEPLAQQARAFVNAQLARLTDDERTPLSTVVARWRLADGDALLPPPRPETWDDDSTFDPLAALITGPLHWLGHVQLFTPHPAGLVDEATVLVAAGAAMAHPPAAPCTMPKQPVNTIVAPHHVLPVHLARLARFCTWTVATDPTPFPHTFTLAPEQLAQLAAQGTAAAHLLDHLTAALGRPPSRRVAQRVRRWLEPGQQLQLRSLFVLEADSAERLAQLRRHKLVRNRLREPLAPNRYTLSPDDAPALAQTLRTLGYFVEPPAPEPTPAPQPAYVDNDPPTAQAGLSPQLQWYLITLYQALGTQIPLPIDLPWAVRQELRRQLTPQQQAGAEAAAQLAMARLQAALDGYLQLPAWHMPATPDPQPLVQAALDGGHDLEIRYWGPSDGHVTTRQVTPYWIEERGTTQYLIGWCHVRQQERTFRLDRIEAARVVGSE